MPLKADFGAQFCHRRSFLVFCCHRRSILADEKIPARVRIDAARRQRPGRLFRYIYLGGAYLGGGFAPGYDPDMKMPRKARDALGRAENG